MTRSNWIGQTIGGRYEIQDLLGEGGMSAVYKAYDPNLRRVVAVKIIHPHLSRDQQFVHRFEEEAAAVAQLRHPNLIQVYDFNHDQDDYFIIFEFVPGETVQDRLKRMKTAGRTMDVGEAIKITGQVADGLQNAHSKGLIHRDIKPANIMLNVTGDPIIMDFGIAKIMGGTQHTATGAVLGTARYMSPEQIEGRQIDPRTDLYSLGVTLFEMLGGRPPFEANSAMTLMMMHMTDPIPDLNAIRSEVSPDLVAVVNKSLAKKPEDRFRSAAEMAAALRAAGKGGSMAIAATMLEPPAAKQVDPQETMLEPITAVKTVPPVPAIVPPAAPFEAPPAAPIAAPAKSGGSRSLLTIAGALLLLLLIAGGIWAVFFRDTGEGEVAGDPTEIPAIVVEPTETPDAAATQEAIDAAAAAAEETRVPPVPQTAEAVTAQATDPPEPTDEATLEATETAEPIVDSVAAVDEVEGNVLMINSDGEEIPLTTDTPITAGSEFITGADGLLTLTLEDAGILQMLEESHVSLDALGSDPANELGQTSYTMFAGDILLRLPPGASEQTIFSETGALLATLSNNRTVSDAGKQVTLGKRARQNADEAAMTIGMDEIRVFIACYSGVCSTGNGNALSVGWEKVLAKDGAFISSFQITTESASYDLWQSSCDGCLPQASGPPPTATATLPATATSPATATTVGTATPTPAGMTVTPTVVATTEGTPTPTAEAVSFSARINGITLENGRYIVNFSTIGYTAQVPGRHVHFYFDTVSEANAGSPGSGPWKLYGGPSPFTEYAESDRVFEPSAMCIRVANEDHSIVFGSGNCFPLP